MCRGHCNPVLFGIRMEDSPRQHEQLEPPLAIAFAARAARHLDAHTNYARPADELAAPSLGGGADGFWSHYNQSTPNPDRNNVVADVKCSFYCDQGGDKTRRF